MKKKRISPLAVSDIFAAIHAGKRLCVRKKVDSGYREVGALLYYTSEGQKGIPCLYILPQLPTLIPAMKLNSYAAIGGDPYWKKMSRRMERLVSTLSNPAYTLWEAPFTKKQFPEKVVAGIPNNVYNWLDAGRLLFKEETASHFIMSHKDTE